MIKHSTVFHPRIIRIVEIILLSLFIISLFFPYVWGVRPKEFFWDIWGSDGIDEDWPFIFTISLPLVLSFILFILITVKPKFGDLTFKFLKWFITIIYTFILVLFLIYPGLLFDLRPSFNLLHSPPMIFTIVLSLCLFLVTLFMTKDNYIKIENYILAIITIPVAYYFFGFLEFDFGGYLLNICFAVLYVIAILKVFPLKKIEENPTA
ncbi:MAG: hypothetical protein K8R63_09010 [Bacteroidales bacterium]|nr:hypothetical protein [Bacteroidales bacterium]